MLGVWAHWKWLAPAMHYTPSPGQPDIMGDVRARACVCVCVCARARACACVCVCGGGPDTMISLHDIPGAKHLHA